VFPVPGNLACREPYDVKAGREKSIFTKIADLT